MNFNTKFILFTGAGFTKNFGGFLADEIWAQIFNLSIIQSRIRLIELMKNPGVLFDIEFIYQIVMDFKDYDDGDKNAIKFAIEEVFSKMDFNLLNGIDNSGIDINMVNNFINKFSTEQERGIFFTINQDLFIERFYNLKICKSPGVRITSTRATPRAHLRNMGYGEPLSYEEIINNEKDYFSQHNFFYIKLHGSQNWMTRAVPNGMILGSRKREMIDKEPILGWNYQLFEKALSNKNSKILIIGYGFRDEHINEIINNAVIKSGLKIYVITPESPRDFRNRILQAPYEIWQGLSGFYPFTLRDLFPKNRRISEKLRDLEKQFFGQP